MEMQIGFNTKARAILCLSGGLDSYVAWLKLGKPLCIHFTGHSRYSKRELLAVERLAARHSDMQYLVTGLYWMSKFEQDDAWIPARNWIFVSVASYFADVVYLPCQRGERDIEDRSDEFFELMSRELSKQHRRQILVDPVFRDETKQDLVKWYLDNGYPLANLRLTYSCFSGNERRCGRCPACFRLAVSLEYNQIPAGDWFETDPFEWSGVKEYVSKLLAGHYEARRTEQTLQVLGKIGLV